jgi:hypothetical protein
MSLEYYLYYKKHYETIINNINVIIDSYQRTTVNLCNEFDYAIKSNKDNDFDILEKEIFFYIEEKKRINELLKECKKNVNELCCHEIEEDIIEFGPEDCKLIKYCRICEITF